MRNLQYILTLTIVLSSIVATEYASGQSALDRNGSSRVRRQSHSTYLKPMNQGSIGAPSNVAPTSRSNSSVQVSLGDSSIRTAQLPTPTTTQSLKVSNSKTVVAPNRQPPKAADSVQQVPSSLTTGSVSRLSDRVTPAANSVEMNFSSRRYTLVGNSDPSIPMASNPPQRHQTTTPLVASRSSSPMRTPNAVSSRVSIQGLGIKDISNAKFADPEKFLKQGKFKFVDPDKFLAEEKPQPKETTPARKKVLAKLASSRNKKKTPSKQEQETDIEPLPSLADSSEQQSPSDQMLLTDQSPAPAKAPQLDTPGFPMVDDDEASLTVSDVRQPISMNPFGEIEQSDPRGMITASPLYRPQVSARSYSEITGLPFQPHHSGWSAHKFRHKPLYFDEVNLERYGNEVRFQHWASALHFFGSAAILPYKMGQQPPGCCETTLGHYRPGECVPYQIHRHPFSKRGFFYQALAITTLSL